MNARRWSPDVVELGDRIVALTVAQAALLSAYLEEVHGIAADASPVLPPPPKPDVIVPLPEPVEFDVVLEGYEPDRRIGVIRMVHENADLGLKEARDFVEAVPKVLKERLARADAEKLKALLESAGAKVRVKPAGE